jgi:hypothetical protein
VLLDLRLPAEIFAMPGLIDFGNVVQGTSPTSLLSVANGVDTILWRTGIANLIYSLSASTGFTAPAGSFTDAAGGGGNTHSIGINTTTLGSKNGTLTVTATDPWVNPTSIVLTANVIPDAIAPNAMSLSVGQVTGGGLPELAHSDDQRLNWQNGNWYVGGRFSPVFKGEFEATSSLAAPSSMTFELESQATGQFWQDIELFDYVAQNWVLVDSRPTTTGDTTAVLSLVNPGRFVESGTRRMKARVTVTPSSWSQPRILSGSFDRLVWKPR